MKQNLYDWSLENNKHYLINEWDYTKNGILTPINVSPYQHYIVHWKCNKGHEWQAIIYSRTRGSSCPYCAGQKVIAGENDLKTLYPEIAKEWNPSKNGKLTPINVAVKSNLKVWWKCARGHEWFAYVYSRTNGHNCPYCAGQKTITGENDLETLYPELAKEWHPTKNGALTACDVMPGTHHKVWWKCKNCGLDWFATVCDRTSNKNCPYCAGKKISVGYNDLNTLYPEIAKQWHPTKNGTLTSEDVTAKSNKKVWWKCSNGHEWQAFVYSRKVNSLCPICQKKKKNYYKIIT